MSFVAKTKKSSNIHMQIHKWVHSHSFIFENNQIYTLNMFTDLYTWWTLERVQVAWNMLLPQILYYSILYS